MLKIGQNVCNTVEEMARSEKKTRYTLMANQIGEQIRGLRFKVSTMADRDAAAADSEE